LTAKPKETDMNKQPSTWTMTLGVARLVIWTMAFAVLGLTWLLTVPMLFSKDTNAIQQAALAAMGSFQAISTYGLARALIFGLGQFERFVNRPTEEEAPAAIPVHNRVA
jgi:hypothetical protein